MRNCSSIQPHLPQHSTVKHDDKPVSTYILRGENFENILQKCNNRALSYNSLPSKRWNLGVLLPFSAAVTDSYVVYTSLANKHRAFKQKTYTTKNNLQKYERITHFHHRYTHQREYMTQCARTYTRSFISGPDSACNKACNNGLRYARYTRITCWDRNPDSVTNAVLSTAAGRCSFLQYEGQQVLEKVWNIVVACTTQRREWVSRI